MSKRRPRKAQKPPPRLRTARDSSTSEPATLQYKVVELSTVDERNLESAANTWASLGWSLDGVQFAMRESSKRPSMAFMFFTRPGSPARAEGAVPPQVLSDRPRPEADAMMRLRELAGDSEMP
jgi:hypothetical protein